jgi:hypothetical protein
MTFHLVLPLDLDITLVSRRIFDDEEQAQQYRAERYTTIVAMEVWPHEQVEKISTRKVLFPEKGENA